MPNLRRMRRREVKMEWDYWDENWEMMVVGWETRSGEKDNLNLVIFHCVHLRIVLFIFRPHTPWIKYYIPWNIIYLFPPLSLFFSYIIFFYLCLHIYSPCYVMFLMVYFLFIHQKILGPSTSSWCECSWHGKGFRVFEQIFLVLRSR